MQENSHPNRLKNPILKTLTFLILLAVLFAVFYHTLQYRFSDEDGIEGIQQLYKQKEDSIDVLCLGSSHMFVDVNTAVLWDEYGIAAYDLGGTIQPLWNTYFYMKEALKTQTPKLIVLDCYTATLTEEYQEESGMIKNTFGMKFSKNKIDAIYASAEKDRFAYLLGFPGFHSRYASLSKEDFAKNKGIAHYDSWKGQHMLTETADNIADLRMDNIKEITDTEELGAKQQEYLYKIIELAKAENIPLLLINTPYFPTEREEKIYNKIARIAEEEQIPYINYNLLYDEMGLDFTSDFADGHHLNYKGSPKFTRLLAQDIKNSFDIPDRRGDEAYGDYDMMSACYDQKVQNQKLTETDDLETYLDAVQDSHYLVVYALSGGFAYADNYGLIQEKLNRYGISPDGELGNQYYVVDTDNNELVYSFDGSEWHSELGTYDVVSVHCPDETDYADGDTSVIIEYNHEKYCPVYEGLTVFVYDTLNETMVETVGFYLENGSVCTTKWR